MREDISHLVNPSDSHYDGLFKLITRIESMETTLQTSTKTGINLWYNNFQNFHKTLDKISLLESKFQDVPEKLDKQNNTIQTLRREIEYLPEDIVNQDLELFRDFSQFENNIKRYIDRRFIDLYQMLNNNNTQDANQNMKQKWDEMLEAKLQTFYDKLSNDSRVAKKRPLLCCVKLVHNY